ncbi:MAG TPA: PEP-utilizing enzyme, partial [Candidatus Obscuribacterales bacterium]
MFPPQHHHLEVALSEKLTAESAASPLVDAFATLNSVKHEVFSAQSLEATNLITGVAAASGRVVAKAQVIRGVSHNWSSIPPGTIIVAKNVHPDWLVLLRHAAGVVAEQGGMTCHAAIIARELGIPAVVGAADATRLIQSGDDLMVDGDNGEVHIGEWGTDDPLWELGAMGNPETAIGIGGNGEWLPAPDAQSSVSNRDYLIPIATQLLVNLNQPNSIQRAANLPVDGVGLLRSELIVLEVLEDRPPLWWLQQGRKRELVQKLTEKIWQFARAFEPRPVFYRSLDMRDSLAVAALNEKFPSSASFGSTEVDPMLGMRGTLSYIADPILF